MYEVKVARKEMRKIVQMPINAQKVFKRLLNDLRETGPVQPGYHNYSPIGKNEYHCHLAYKWVACWRNEKGSLKVEVYYVGSRENVKY